MTMNNPTFVQAVAGFGEPFPYQAGPFVTEPTAIYEHDAQATYAANGGATNGLGAREPSNYDTLKIAMMVAGTAASMAGAYHGYKRNESVGWAFGWALFGGLIWPLAIPVMFAQGFGKPVAKPATANRNASKNRQRLSIKTIADAIAHDHIADPLVGSTVKASDVDMFEDHTLRMALREHGFTTAPKNVQKLRIELRKSLGRAERSNR